MADDQEVGKGNENTIHPILESGIYSSPYAIEMGSPCAYSSTPRRDTAKIAVQQGNAAKCNQCARNSQVVATLKAGSASWQVQILRESAKIVQSSNSLADGIGDSYIRDWGMRQATFKCRPDLVSPAFSPQLPIPNPESQLRRVLMDRRTFLPARVPVWHSVSIRPEPLPGPVKKPNASA